MDSPKLKPCPACGSSAELYAGDVPGRDYVSVQILIAQCVGRSEIMPKTLCGNGTPSHADTRSRPTPWTAKEARRENTGAITMTDRLIGKRDIAAMLGTSPGVAVPFGGDTCRKTTACWQR